MAVEVGVQLRLKDVVEHRLLAFLFRFERLRIVQHFAVAVPENVRGVPAVHAKQPCLQARGNHRLDERLAGLEILAHDRQLLPLRQRHHRRHIGREVRRAIGVRHAFHQRRVGVNHARRNRRIVRFETLLERVDRLVRRRLGHEHFGAAAPHHHHAIETAIFFEGADVGSQLVGEIFFVVARLHVRAVEPLHVSLIEHGGPRFDGLELRLDLIEQARLEHAGRARSLIAVVVEDIPAAELDMVEVDERHHFVDLRRAPFGALAEPNGAHLRERSDRLGESLADGQHARNRGGADGPKAHEKDTQFAPGWCDLGLFHNRKLYH